MSWVYILTYQWFFLWICDRLHFPATLYVWSGWDWVAVSCIDWGSCGGDTNDINQDKVIADTESNVVTRRGSVTALGPAQLPPDTKIASRCLESWRTGAGGGWRTVAVAGGGRCRLWHTRVAASCLSWKRRSAFSQSRRMPLLEPSPSWKYLLALSHLRHEIKVIR